jgi:hypothetical protein
VEGTSGAVTGGRFRERSDVATLKGPPRFRDGSGERILQGFRKESSEGSVSGRLLSADVIQYAGGISERQEVSGSIGLG